MNPQAWFADTLTKLVNRWPMANALGLLENTRQGVNGAPLPEQGARVVAGTGLGGRSVISLRGLRLCASKAPLRQMERGEGSPRQAGRSGGTARDLSQFLHEPDPTERSGDPVKVSS